MNRRGSEIEKNILKKHSYRNSRPSLLLTWREITPMRLEKRAFVAYHGGKIKETK